MKYIDILDRIEEGQFNVKQAVKEIEKRANHQVKARAKKISIKVHDEDTKFRLSFLRIGFLTGLLSMSKPFLNFIPKHNISDDQVEIEGNIGRDEIKLIIEIAKTFLSDFKTLPPMTIVSVKTKDTVVLIETK